MGKQRVNNAYRNPTELSDFFEELLKEPDALPLVEIEFQNSGLDGAPSLILRNQENRSLAWSLDHLAALKRIPTVGEVSSICIYVFRKRIELHFERLENGRFLVRYLPQLLSNSECVEFEQLMKDICGTAILKMDKEWRNTMGVSPRIDVFKRGLKIDLPSLNYEPIVDRLEKQGFIAVERYEYMPCIGGWTVPACKGILVLEPDMEGQELRCPSCGRPVMPEKRTTRLRLSPRTDVILEFMTDVLRKVTPDVRLEADGLFRLEDSVRVVMLDPCTEPDVLEDFYPERHDVVYVVGNERDLSNLMPPKARAFNLLELVDGSAVPSLTKELRDRLRVARTVSKKPAVMQASKLFVPSQVEKSVAHRSTKYPEVTRIPTPPGTSWEEVTIYLVDGDTLGVEVPGSRFKRYSIHQLGMTDRRTKKAKAIWRLMQALCEGGGACHWKAAGKSFENFTTMLSQSRLLLQAVFGIDRDPFPECSRDKGVVAAFDAYPDLPRSKTRNEDIWTTVGRIAQRHMDA